MGISGDYNTNRIEHIKTVTGTTQASYTFQNLPQRYHHYLVVYSMSFNATLTGTLRLNSDDGNYLNIGGDPVNTIWKTTVSTGYVINANAAAAWTCNGQILINRINGYASGSWFDASDSSSAYVSATPPVLAAAVSRIDVIFGGGGALTAGEMHIYGVY